MTLQVPNVPITGNEITGAIVDMIDRVQPSVVQVRSEGRGIGAGVIWSADGQIITNNHVVATNNQTRKVEILLTDGREFEARVIALNPSLDLALLKIEANALPALPPGDGSRLRVGELVFAVGHPWGVRGVVTAGIISGLGEVRVPGSRSGRTAQYIRSDVRLAPGNSGGPLLNAQGNVIGINAMIFGGDLGIAIPGQVVSEWLTGLKAGPKSYLGAGVQPRRLRITMPDQSQPIEVTGLKIVTLKPQGPAARAGLKIADVLLEIGGERVQGVQSLTARLNQPGPDSSLSFGFLRGESIQTLEVKLDQVERGE